MSEEIAAHIIKGSRRAVTLDKLPRNESFSRKLQLRIYLYKNITCTLRIYACGLL